MTLQFFEHTRFRGFSQNLVPREWQAWGVTQGSGPSVTLKVVLVLIPCLFT